MLSVTAASRFGMTPSKRVDKAHEDGIWSVVWTAKNKIISGSVDEVVAVRADDLTLTHQFADHLMGVVGVSCDASGSLAAASSIDCKIRLYDLDAGRHKTTIDCGPVECWTCALSPDGRFVAAGSYSGNVNVWEVSGAKVATLACAHRDAAGFAMDVSFSPDGAKLAASCLDGCVSVFDVATNERISAFTKGHKASARTVAWSPDSKRLFSGSDDTRVLEYDQETVVNQYTRHTSWVLGVRVSPDGLRLASCSADRTVKIWDLELADVAVILETHLDQVWGIAWSPDGQSLVSCGDDAALQVYHVSEPHPPKLEECYANNPKLANGPIQAAALAAENIFKRIKLDAPDGPAPHDAPIELPPRREDDPPTGPSAAPMDVEA